MIEHHINLLSSQFQREQLEEETESSRHYPTSGYPSHLKCVCVGGGEISLSLQNSRKSSLCVCISCGDFKQVITNHNKLHYRNERSLASDTL